MEVTGNAAAVNAVKLVARVEGYLDKIHYEDGQFVKKGDLLFTIQQDQYKDQLQQAQAQVLAAQAALTHAKTELVRVLSSSSSRTRRPRPRSTIGLSSGRVPRRQLLSAQAQVALAKLNLSYTEVRAPFDGIVGKHLIDPGNVVGGGGQQSALAEITQLDPIYVVANLSEQDVLKIRANLGQHRLTLADLHKVPVDVALSDETGFPHRGHASNMSRRRSTRRPEHYWCAASFRTRTGSCCPGFFVQDAPADGKVDRNALLVPDRALQEDQGGRYLLVLNKDDVVEQRYVQLGQLVGHAAGRHLGPQAGRPRRRRRPLARHPGHQGDAAADARSTRPLSTGAKP